MGKKVKYFGGKKNNWVDPNEPPTDVRIFFSTYFCGCGEPEEAMESFKELMGLFEDDVISLGKLNVFEEKYGKGHSILMLYFLGGMNLTEHGGSVYGCWLTKLGQDVKEYLEKNPDYLP